LINKIGLKIKFIRKNKKITLSTLSEKTGISIGQLSNIERDLRSPSIANLQKICDVLEMPLNDLLTLSEERLCVKKGERIPVFDEYTQHNTTVTYESIIESNRILSGRCMTIHDKNVYHTSTGHRRDEVGIVFQGEVEFIINGESYLLQEGDTLYIPAGYDHSFRRTSDDICISYWINVTIDLQPHPEREEVPSHLNSK